MADRFEAKSVNLEHRKTGSLRLHESIMNTENWSTFKKARWDLCRQSVLHCTYETGQPTVRKLIRVVTQTIKVIPSSYSTSGKFDKNKYNDYNF